MPNAPKLSDDAKEELPAAQDKVSQTRGSFLLWVLRIQTFIILVVCPLVYMDMKGRLNECDKRAEAITERFINKLEKLGDRVSTVEQKADTTLNRAIEKTK